MATRISGPGLDDWHWRPWHFPEMTIMVIVLSLSKADLCLFLQFFIFMLLLERGKNSKFAYDVTRTRIHGSVNASFSASACMAYISRHKNQSVVETFSPCVSESIQCLFLHQYTQRQFNNSRCKKIKSVNRIYREKRVSRLEINILIHVSSQGY